MNRTSTSASQSDLHPLTEAIRSGLRRAAPPDAEAVRSLTRKAYAKWIPVIGREPKPMTADYEVAVRDHSTCWNWMENWLHSSRCALRPTTYSS